MARPNKQQLLAYARELQDELDSFSLGEARHQIKITDSPDLIECAVEIILGKERIPISEENIVPGDISTAKLLSELSSELRYQVSQWFYVQKGLQLFDGPRVFIYKSPRTMDWSRTQALNDANNIIGTSLSM